MIKLNNKNITYVALADSNNSIKAPKEIWYADSNNSVKLVYRRKDALIEGEDYEKYHWLKGDGSAYINSNYLLTFNDIKTSVFRAYGEGSFEGSRYEEVVDTGGKGTCIGVFGGATWGSFFSTDGRMALWNLRPISLGKEHTVIMSKNGVTLDGVVPSSGYNNVPLIGSQFESTLPYLIFASWKYNSKVDDRTALLDYRSFKIDGKLNLIPCKLLKPVPKWLDANGIRRQVGECGMIDLVSGKFYGNVNNEGTFTVKNYYERKEWLVGDGSAYIDTGHNVNEDLDYETKVHLLPNTYLFWYRTKSDTGDNTMVVRSDTNTWIGQRVANNSYDRKITDTNDAIEVKWDGIYVYINDTKYKVTKNIQLSQEFNLFYIRLESSQDTSFYTSNNVKCSYFRFLDSNRDYIQNLIPCTLTMDLPASMDANNIARTKGTSGMWDLVSDKFYGNVANSGTFKAVNLAEGVDYEVHQWLKGDLKSYIQLDNHYNTDELAYIETVAQLYDNSNPHIAIIIGNNNSDDNGGHCLRMTFHNPLDMCDAHRRWNGHQDSVRNFFNNDYGVHTYYLSLTDFIVDGVSYPFTYGSRFDDLMDCPYTRVFFGSSKFNSIKLRANNTTFSLIPVKLLKFIPSKYDANGIERQAGECGMYDTVNDVFYGNVASRGTFSVSD